MFITINKLKETMKIFQNDPDEFSARQFVKHADSALKASSKKSFLSTLSNVHSIYGYLAVLMLINGSACSLKMLR